MSRCGVLFNEFRPQPLAHLLGGRGREGHHQDSTDVAILGEMRLFFLRGYTMDEAYKIIGLSGSGTRFDDCEARIQFEVFKFKFRVHSWVISSLLLIRTLF